MNPQFERLFSAAKAKGIRNQSALADALHQTPQTVHNWQKRGVSRQAMVDAQRTFGCSASWIESGQGDMWVPGKEPAPGDETGAGLGREVVHARPGFPPVGYVRLELLNVEASAGRSALPVDQIEVLRHLDVLEEWVRRELRVSGTAARVRIITARGDSMVPTIHENDIVFVDTGVSSLESEGVYVMLWGEHLVIKRLQRLIDGRVAIISDNRQRYDTQYADKGTELQICGRVLGRWALERL